METLQGTKTYTLQQQRKHTVCACQKRNHRGRFYGVARGSWVHCVGPVEWKLHEETTFAPTSLLMKKLSRENVCLPQSPKHLVYECGKEAKLIIVFWFFLVCSVSEGTPRNEMTWTTIAPSVAQWPVFLQFSALGSRAAGQFQNSDPSSKITSLFPALSNFSTTH